MLLISVVFVLLMVVGMPVAFATGIAGFVVRFVEHDLVITAVV